MIIIIIIIKIIIIIIILLKWFKSVNQWKVHWLMYSENKVEKPTVRD